MHVALHLVGRSGLVFHNQRLADPQDEYTKAISEINAKKTKKTEADQQTIEKLEWFGGLYHDPEVGIYLPTWNIVRALERAGTATRQGTQLVAAFSVNGDKAPLCYDGPKDLEALYARPEFRFRAMVGINRNRVPRMRPIFRRWEINLEGYLVEELMNPEDFNRIAQLAGVSSGLGDARKLGYGRFGASVALVREVAS